MWSVVVCDQEISCDEEAIARAGLQREKNTIYYTTLNCTPRSRVLLEKLTGLELVKKFPAFY
jgi:hypothetical protein